MLRSFVPILLPLLAAVIGGVGGCDTRSAQRNEAVAVNSAARHARVFLIPSTPSSTDRRSAQEVWQTLFDEMVQSPDAAADLKALCPDLPVEFHATSVTDPASPETIVKPPTGSGVAIQVVAVRPGLDDWSRIVAVIGGRSDAPVECLLGELLIATSTKRKTETIDLKQPEFDDQAFLIAAANKHLLREKSGWTMVDEPTARAYIEKQQSKSKP